MIPIRILSAQPSKDGEKWTITAQRHNDDWFTDAYGQNPQPFYRNPFTSPPNRLPYPWRTGLTPNDSSDPLLPFPENSAAVYRSGSDVYVFGALPVNKLSTIAGAPQVGAQATVASTGGFVPAGTLYLQVCTIDTNGDVSQPSNFIVAVIPSGTTNTVTVPNVVFGANADGYRVFAGWDPMRMWSVFDDTTTPSSITIDSLAPLYTLTGYDVGRPDINANNFRVIITKIRHNGIWGAGPTAVGAHTITIPHSPLTNAYAGRVISRLASSTIQSGGILDGLTIGGGLHMAVSSNDNAGVITVPNTLTGVGAVIPPVAIGDVFVMRAYANIASANTIGDSMFVSDFAPSGLAVDAEKGSVVWIIAGTGKGQSATILSNTSTTLTIDGTWQTIPDATSVFVILESAVVMPPVDTIPFVNSVVGSAGLTAMKVVAQITVPMTEAGTYLVRVASEDKSGRISVVAYAPWQEVYLTPELTQAEVSTTPYTVQPSDEVLTFVTGSSVVDLPSLGSLLRDTIWLINDSGATLTVNAAAGDTIEGAASLTIYPGTRYQLMPRS